MKATINRAMGDLCTLYVPACKQEYFWIWKFRCLAVLPGSCVRICSGETERFWLNGILDRNIVRESKLVGLVEPGRDASNGNTPSPVSSIEIGMFSLVSGILEGYYGLSGCLVVVN